MKTGLIGLPLSGKTTFFKLLFDNTKNDIQNTKGKMNVNYASVKVPDERIDILSAVYEPKKITYATIDVVDIPGIVPGAREGNLSSSLHFFEAVRRSDALVHVIRAFEDEMTVHIDGHTDAYRDIATVDLEIIFADLALIEKRMNSIDNSKKITEDMKLEIEVLTKCQAHLEKERPLMGMALDAKEHEAIKQLNFLTQRPVIYLINLDETQFISGKYKNCDKVREHIRNIGAPLIEVCAQIELEISELDEQDREMFKRDLGLEETGVEKLTKAIYQSLGLISFITVGEDEVRAWPLVEGLNAKQAGGSIHSDIARGFIRAEVVKYSDFQRLGSMQKIKESGLARLEGKNYIIEDGDMIDFRFNV